jgi:hypothetical protein
LVLAFVVGVFLGAADTFGGGSLFLASLLVFFTGAFLGAAVVYIGVGDGPYNRLKRNLSEAVLLFTLFHTLALSIHRKHTFTSLHFTVPATLSSVPAVRRAHFIGSRGGSDRPEKRGL